MPDSSTPCGRATCYLLLPLWTLHAVRLMGFFEKCMAPFDPFLFFHDEWRKIGCNAQWAEMWPKCGGNVAEMWRKCGRNVAEMWPKCGRNVAEMWPKCGRNVAEMGQNETWQKWDGNWTVFQGLAETSNTLCTVGSHP
jgi:hypothetical protein